MEVRQNLIRLCEKINDGHYKITPDCAEYKMFEKWITDEQIAVMLALIVAGRLLSGVHWFTDILGGILLSVALLNAWEALLKLWKKRK